MRFSKKSEVHVEVSDEPAKPMPEEPKDHPHLREYMVNKRPFRIKIFIPDDASPSVVDALFEAALLDMVKKKLNPTGTLRKQGDRRYQWL